MSDGPRPGAGPGVTRVAVVTNVLPHYREAFYRLLFQREDLDVRVFCQASIPGMALAVVHDRFPGRVTVVPAWSLKRDVMSWQRLPWRRLLDDFDVVCVHGNPRALSNVVLSLRARIRGKPVILWGQARTAGAPAVTEAIRLAWWRRFDHLFVYTDAEARWLVERRGFRGHHVTGMNNGLDQDRIDRAAAAWSGSDLAGWRERQGLAGRAVVLSCARLDRKNEFDVWLSAMPAVRERHPDLLWCAIGDGPERAALETRARSLGVEGSVRWAGALYDEAELAPWFLSSRALIHPGAIGLTLLHAFGYGLPVITHDDHAGHMPEFAAFVAGETGFAFRRGDPADLAGSVERCLTDEARARHMGERARRIAREDYNVVVMVDRFATAVRLAKEPA